MTSPVRFPANCFIVAFGAAMLGQGKVKFTRDRRGNLHSYWLDRKGKAREFYTKGASSWPWWKKVIRMGEIRRCPSYDINNNRRDAAKAKRAMKTFNRVQEPRKVIVIVNGYPRSGKDTFVDLAATYFASIGWGSYAMSSIDWIKKITGDAGITEEPKTPEKRALWAELKNAFEKYDRLVSRRTMHRMESQFFQSSLMKQVGFIHAREPDAISFMKTLATDEFITVFVDRPDAERVQSNEADMGVEAFQYDFVIRNHGDLTALQGTAQQFALEIVSMKGARS